MKFSYSINVGQMLVLWLLVVVLILRNVNASDHESLVSLMQVLITFGIFLYTAGWIGVRIQARRAKKSL